MPSVEEVLFHIQCAKNAIRDGRNRTMTDTEKKIAEIKQALEKVTPRWHYNGNEIVLLDNPRVGIGGFLRDENNYLAANAPEWLGFLLDELERLEREYAEERAAHNYALESNITLVEKDN